MSPAPLSLWPSPVARKSPEEQLRVIMVQNLDFDHRTIVVGLVWNRDNELLFCRMDSERGVFPGQWGFPGGGIEPGERMKEALRRELREELGVEVENIRPAFFKDCTHDKVFADGSTKPVYMIFLLFHCTAASEDLHLNDEFVDYRWVSEGDLGDMELNCRNIGH